MATIKTARILNQWDLVENLDDAPAAGTSTITSKAFNPGVLTLSPTSDPATSKYAGWQPQIPTSSSGILTLSIDLTNLPGTEEEIDGTGLKLRRLRLQNPSDNDAGVTIQPAAVDGYHLFGADNAVEVPVGGMIDISFGDEAPVVGSWSGSTNQYLELVGDAEDIYKLEILLG